MSPSAALGAGASQVVGERQEALLEVDGLVVHYRITGAGKVFRKHETVHAVDGVSFDLAPR